jgi:hypothetical protein
MDSWVGAVLSSGASARVGNYCLRNRRLSTWQPEYERDNQSRRGGLNFNWSVARVGQIKMPDSLQHGWRRGALLEIC